MRSVRLRLALVVLSVVGSVAVPASAENPPELGARNFFTAVGSAQDTFVLEEDAVLETFSWWSIDLETQLLDDDAHLRTEGNWAALVIQRVAPEQTATVAFTSLPNASPCPQHDPTCEPFEDDDGYGSELAKTQTDSYHSPRYLLRAGTYVVAILGEPGTRTTAALSLTGEQPSTPSEHAAEYAMREVGARTQPHHVLADSTLATMQVSQQQSLTSSGFKGSFDGATPSLSRLFDGLLYNAFLNERDPSITDIKHCLEWADLTKKACWDHRITGTCMCQAFGWGQSFGEWTRVWDAKPGLLRMTWDVQADEYVSRATAYLIVWPYVT